MNKGILIFTDNYPFGKSEQFLDAELQFIIRSFDTVAIFPVEEGKDKNLRPTTGKSEILKPVFSYMKNKPAFIFKGLFNRSLLFTLIKAGMKAGVWKSRKKFRIWAIHLLMIRGLLSEIKHRNLIKFFKQFDILYFYWGLRWSQILPFLPEDIKAKIIVRFHGSDLYEHTNNDYIPWRHEQLLRISKAIAISETGKKYIEDQYPFLKGKIIVSRIGTKNFGLNPYIRSATLIIVSCSNLVPVKRVDLIAKSIALLNIPAVWIHFGDGPEMNEVRKLTDRFPAFIKAELRGEVEHDELMDYYRTSSTDLFINVSRSEGVPVSVMEAMSFGIPVIATNVGGTSEIVSEKTGLLIEKDFLPEELAARIEELINRKDYSLIRSTARAEWENKSMAEKVYPGFINNIDSI
jgi:colanic acid/amylovoran biosynthesis glycosyltransferase